MAKFRQKTVKKWRNFAKSENQNQLAEIVSVDECCKCNNSGEKTVACATIVVPQNRQVRSQYTPVTEPNDQQKRTVEADRRSKCVLYFGLRS